MLKQYINNVSNTNSLKEFIDSEVIKVKRALKTLLPKIDDKITKIKLSEAINYTDEATKGKVVKDKHVVALMRYYELIKEIKMSNHDKIAKLKEIIRHLVVQELRKDDIEEASTTASAGAANPMGTGIHYDTPKAFSSGSAVGHKSPEVGGYKKSKKIKTLVTKTTNQIC